MSSSCSDNALEEITGTIWDGPETSFAKDGEADHNLEENQDRITDLVWITRSSDGGQIFNAKTEDTFNKFTSPEGTEWAFGRVDDVQNLSFNRFRATVMSPKEVVGQDLVVHLIEEDIYINVTFTSWDQNMIGGFSYTRSTP